MKNGLVYNYICYTFLHVGSIDSTNDATTWKNPVNKSMEFLSQINMELIEFNPAVSETEIFFQNNVYDIAADALDNYIVRTLATAILTTWDDRMFAFDESEPPLPVSSQCWKGMQLYS